MSYDHQKNFLLLPDTATPAADDYDIALGTSGVVAAQPVTGGIPMMVEAAFAQVVTTFDTADTVLTISRRPTPGSDTGKVSIGTLTIPNAAAAPNVYYKEFTTPTKVSPGEEILIETDGGTTNGTAILSLRMRPVWEHPSNNTKMIASA